MNQNKHYTIGSYCSVKIDDEEYPAIYITRRKSKHLVYLRHTDSLMLTSRVGDTDIIPLKEKVSEVLFSLMESPSYFRFGTGLFIKWGGNAYQINSGRKQEFNANAMCDKIVSTLSL